MVRCWKGFRLEEVRVPAKEAKNWKIEGQKGESREKKIWSFWICLRNGEFRGAKRILKSRKKQRIARKRCPAEGRKRHPSRVWGNAWRKFPEQLVEGRWEKWEKREMEVDKELRKEVGKKRKSEGERRRWNGCQEEMCERRLGGGL